MGQNPMGHHPGWGHEMGQHLQPGHEEAAVTKGCGGACPRSHRGAQLREQDHWRLQDVRVWLRGHQGLHGFEGLLIVIIVNSNNKTNHLSYNHIQILPIKILTFQPCPKY